MLLPGGGYRVVHQAGNRHRPNATRHGRDRRRHILHGIEIDVAHQSAFARFFDPVNADVNNCRTWLDPVGLDKMRAPYRSDQDIGLATEGGDIAGGYRTSRFLLCLCREL